MKKIIWLLSAVIVSGSCINEDMPQVGDGDLAGKGLIIKAELTSESKTDINQGVTTWEAGDEISVIYDGAVYLYKTAGAGNTTTFTSEHGIDNYDATKGIIAYYPPVSIDEVVEVRTAQAVSFEGEAQANVSRAPLVGTAVMGMSPEGALKMIFQNICSVLELRMDACATADCVKSVKIEPASNEGFEGYLSFTGTVNPKTLEITTQSTGNTITLDLPDGTVLNRPITLKFPIGRFKSPSGLMLTVETTDGQTQSRMIYKDGIESYTENASSFSVKHFAKPLYPFVFTMPEVVDLGLSVKWASCNVGASSPDKTGDYIAWGEISPYYSSLDPLTWIKSDGYSWTSYQWCEGSGNSLTKYNTSSSYGTVVDNKTVLQLSDDAAYAVGGGAWRMPTKEEFQELVNNCETYCATLNGTHGVVFLSKKPGFTDKSIFIPAGGVFTGMDLVIDEGYGGGNYWTSSLVTEEPDHAWRVYVNASDSGVIINTRLRRRGQMIRAVMDEEAIDMGLSVKWASCNLGAATPEEYGLYFAWGEVAPKNDYTWETYKWGSTAPFSKYSDADAVLDPEDDAANVLWGNGWRMPTEEEYLELLNPDNCIWTQTTRGEIFGYNVESKLTGKTIFFPAAGRHSETSSSSVNSDGYYWASTFYSSAAKSGTLMKWWNTSTPPFFEKNVKYYGHSIRAVKD